jgi:hypothetical protein
MANLFCSLHFDRKLIVFDVLKMKNEERENFEIWVKFCEVGKNLKEWRFMGI